MNINEAINKLQIAGFEVVDGNNSSLDSLARIIKENYGISSKINKDNIYFDYDEVAVKIDEIYNKKYKVSIIDEATDKSIYQEVRQYKRCSKYT